jgi:hypothetical protein
MLDDLRSALDRLERQPKDQVTRLSKARAKTPTKTPAREAGTGSRQDNASNKASCASRKTNE